VPSISRALGLACAALAAAQGQTITSRPVFVGREPLTIEQRRVFLDFATRLPKDRSSRIIFPATHALLANPTIDPAVAARYSEVSARTSLLVNDCDSFCDDPFFAFGRIVERGAHAVAIADSTKTAGNWYQGLNGVVPDYQNHVKPWTGSNSDQFQLLAVVNRIDLATPGAGDSWQGAELRFVYGARTVSIGPEPFGVIVEFVLPALSWKDFRTLVGEWHDLRPLQGAVFAAKLKSLLQESWSPVSDSPNAHTTDLVRIRTNSVSASGNAPWFFSQWTLSQGKLQQTTLDDELYRQCTRRDGINLFPQTGCPQGKPTSCAAYLPMYSQFEQHPGLTLAIQANELLPHTQCYLPSVEVGMDGPKGSCSTDPKTAPLGAWGLARKVLALQQCSNCHGAETNNQGFFHVANRYPQSTAAKLSPFLTGGSAAKPSVDDLNNLDSGAYYKPRIDVTWPGGGDCPPATTHVDRSYNDIARRSLYLAAVLVNDSATPPDSGMTNIIRSYGPNMTH
jgi:hypothetical protein